MASKGTIDEVNQVQVDGLVALKIIKHCQEEGSSTDLVQGFLVGLVIDDRLEITNCFPLPKSLNDPSAELKYQMDILENLRKVNCDYYQDFFESQIPYQTKIMESVVIVYDPLHTTLGSFSLKSYRLTEKILKLTSQEDPFTPESVLESSLKHNEIFEELPVLLRNSHLVNALLCEIEGQEVTPPKLDLLNLSMNREIVNHTRLLIDSVDTLQQETYKLLGYERSSVKQQQIKQQFLQKRKEENIKRVAAGEKPLPEDEKSIEKDMNLKPINPPSRNVALLIAQQVETQCNEVKQIAGQTFPKLYLTDALQTAT